MHSTQLPQFFPILIYLDTVLHTMKCEILLSLNFSEIVTNSYFDINVVVKYIGITDEYN